MRRVTLLAVTAALLSAPLFAQQGKGLGQVRVGGGAGVGARVGTPDVRVGADTRSGAGANVGGAGVGMTARERVDTRTHDMEHARPTLVLTENTHLASRLQTMLPAGQTTESAAAGFKNTGQFIAAVHVANNLNIPFNQLKTSMTGSEKLSLGKAIHQLRPDADSKAEEKKANKQARADLEASARAAVKTESERNSGK